ncbi:MAG: hypothetical protein V1799_20575 [bacterium]
MQFSKKWSVSRLKQIRQRLKGARKQGDNPRKNAIETLFQQVARVPSLTYVGNDRTKRNAIPFPRGKTKYPDFRFTDQNKVIEVIGTHSHDARYSTWLAKTYNRIGIRALLISETDIVNNPQFVHNRAVNFYGRCIKCGSALQSMGTEPPYCPQCGNL